MTHNDPLDEVLTALGLPDAKGIVKRARVCVERRNKLAHQFLDYDDTATGGDDTVIRLMGRRGRVTRVTLGELQDWKTDLMDSTNEILTASALILAHSGVGVELHADSEAGPAADRD